MKKKSFTKYVDEVKNLLGDQKNEEIKIAVVMQYLYDLFFDEEEDATIINHWMELVEALKTDLENSVKYSEKIVDVGYLLLDSLGFASKNLIYECIENEINFFEHFGILKSQVEEGDRRTKVHLLQTRSRQDREREKR